MWEPFANSESSPNALFFFNITTESLGIHGGLHFLGFPVFSFVFFVFFCFFLGGGGGDVQMTVTNPLPTGGTPVWKSRGCTSGIFFNSWVLKRALFELFRPLSTTSIPKCYGNWAQNVLSQNEGNQKWTAEIHIHTSKTTDKIAQNYSAFQCLKLWSAVPSWHRKSGSLTEAKHPRQEPSGKFDAFIIELGAIMKTKQIFKVYNILLTRIVD